MVSSFSLNVVVPLLLLTSFKNHNGSDAFVLPLSQVIPVVETSTALQSIQFLKGQTSFESDRSYGSSAYLPNGGDAGSTTLLRNSLGSRRRSNNQFFGWHRNSISAAAPRTRLAYGSMEIFPVSTDHVQVCIEKSEDNVVDQGLMDRSVQAVMEQWQQKRQRNMGQVTQEQVTQEQVTQTVRVSVADGEAYPFVGTISTPILQDYNDYDPSSEDSVVMVVHNADSTSNTPQLQPGTAGGPLAMSNSNPTSRSNLEATVLPMTSSPLQTTVGGMSQRKKKMVNSNGQQSFNIPMNNQNKQQIQVLLENANGQQMQPWEARIEVYHGVGGKKGMDFKQLLPGNHQNGDPGDCRIALDVASMHNQFSTVMDVMPPNVLEKMYGNSVMRYNPPKSIDQYLEIRVINTGNQPLQASVASSSSNERLVETNPSLIQEQQRILGNNGYRKPQQPYYSPNGGYSNGGYSSQVSANGRPILQPNPFLENDNAFGSRNMGSDINGSTMSSNGYSHRMVSNAQQARVVPYNGRTTGFRPANDFDRRQNQAAQQQRRGGFLGSGQSSSSNRGSSNNIYSSGFLGGLGGSTTPSSTSTNRSYNSNGGNNAWTLRSDKIAGEAQERMSSQTGMMRPMQDINSNRSPYNNNANNNNNPYSRLSNIQSQQRTSIVPRGQRDGAPRIPVNPFLASDQSSATGRGADGWLKRQVTGKPRSITSYRRRTNGEQRTKVEPVITKLFQNNKTKVRKNQSPRNALLEPNPYLPQDRQSVNPYIGKTGSANSLPRPSEAFGLGRINGNTSLQANALPRPSSVFGQSSVQDRRSNALPRPSVATGMMNRQTRPLQNALPRPSAAFGRSSVNNNNNSNRGNSGSFIQDRRSNTLPRPSVVTGRTNNNPSYNLRNALPRPSEVFGRPRIVMADQGLLDEKASRLQYGMVTEEERLRAERSGGYGGYDNNYNANGVNSKWDLNYWMNNNNNNDSKMNGANRNGQRQDSSRFTPKSNSQTSTWTNRGGSNNRSNYNNRSGSPQGLLGSSRNGSRESSTQLASGLQDSSMEEFRSMGGTRSYMNTMNMQEELQRASSANYLSQYNRNGQRQSSYRRSNPGEGGIVSVAKSLLNGLRWGEENDGGHRTSGNYRDNSYQGGRW